MNTFLYAAFSMIILFGSCSPPQVTVIETIPNTPLSASPNTPASEAPTDMPLPEPPLPYPPYPPPELPAKTVYPYPPPKPPTLPPGPTATPSPSPSPTMEKPTPTFPPSLASLRIAYLFQKKLWLWAEGKVTFLTEVDETTYQVKISDDGQVIAFTRPSGLWAIDSHGRGERLLIAADEIKKEPTGSDVEIAGMEWIPDTHVLLFYTRPLTGYGLFYSDDLHRIHADSLYYTRLLRPGLGGKFHISPDGKLVAIVTPTEIRLMGVDGGAYHTSLIYPSVAIPSEFAYYAKPVWASDSQSLLVAIPPKEIHYESLEPTILWQIPVDGKPPVKVAEIPANGFQEVHISPDHTKMAIDRVSKPGSQEETHELHIASIAGNEDKVYPGCTGRFLGWAPDSEGFVCWSEAGVQLGRIGSAETMMIDRCEQLFWLNAQLFLYHYGFSGMQEIRLGFVGEPSLTLIGPESTASWVYFDYTQ